MKAAIKLFQDACGLAPTDGVLDKATLLARMKARVDLFQEERDEFLKALEEKDTLEILDGVIDQMVYLLQDVIDLEAAGVNYVEATERVTANNSLKYTSSYALIWQEFQKWQKVNPALFQALRIEKSYAGKDVYYCLKDMKGKVRKFVDFEKVVLDDLIPEELK